MTDTTATSAFEDVVADSSAGAGFEAVMANAALAGIRGLVPPSELTRFAWAVVRHPKPVASRIGRLATRLVEVGRGHATETPGRLDRRFTDGAWADNPLLNSVALSYLACCDAVEGVLDDAELDWRTKERLRLVIDNVLAASSPTNNPLTNPACWKEFIDTRGRSLRTGAGNLVSDLRSPTRLPRSVDQSAYRFGENIAATPGKVVRRTRSYELIEYYPRAENIDVIPVLVIASPVNKYYLVDLEPEQSVVRAELDRGRRVFVASWVNPDESHADIGFDDYVSSIVGMLETVCDISGSDSSHLLGLCGGGVLVFITAAYLAAVGRQRELATLTIGIAVLDYDRGPSTMAYLDRKQVGRAIRRARKRGYFDARESARSFALIRPVEGIWAAAVHNYLLGKTPPAVGLLYWAADQTNMATRYGGQMLETALGNMLARPGGVCVMGVPIDAAQISVDTYVLAASTDHISPWRDCYRTISMVGGDVTFVLARGGHAIAIAKPPGSARASHRTGDVASADPDAWLAGSLDNPGSWWDHWNVWIEKHSPDKRPAPVRLGSEKYPPIVDAPGEYVRRVLT